MPRRTEQLANVAAVLLVLFDAEGRYREAYLLFLALTLQRRWVVRHRVGTFAKSVVKMINLDRSSRIDRVP